MDNGDGATCQLPAQQDPGSQSCCAKNGVVYGEQDNEYQ